MLVCLLKAPLDILIVITLTAQRKCQFKGLVLCLISNSVPWKEVSRFSFQSNCIETCKVGDGKSEIIPFLYVSLLVKSTP